MAHWRQSYQSSARSNSVVVFVVGTVGFVGALAFILRHV
jgi:hypothetical protein